MTERRRAAVLTVSDGVAEGRREDVSGDEAECLLEDAGFEVVERRVVPDESSLVEEALRELSAAVALVVTTGGTGLGPRDVTPQATQAVVDYEVPGLAEKMRSVGRSSTPFADLSRGVVGAVDRTLVVNLPGSARGAVESLEAVLEVVPHALDLLGCHTAHH